ncbi:ion transporter [Marinimicrobium sp. UBA4509]|uniref:ion transporter n=1 Tax=Marinimicrobium sp. UBA4509 TaxID=1946811 RepID=UPI00257DEE0C|nr:ion transporter [Marinimicrobium sp. UBA4509]
MVHSSSSAKHPWRAWLYRQLEPGAWPDQGLSPANRWICALITVAVLVALLETEPAIRVGREPWFVAFEWVVGAIFLLEYLIRAWVAVEGARYAHPVWGRLRYLGSFAAVVDLLAILPLFLGLVGMEALFMRLIRVLRILRLARLGRFSKALRELGHAVRLRQFELYVSFGLAFLVLLTSSIMLYLLEGGVQPEAFGSVLRSMWWSVATLTTVGYGDVYPVTGLGRFFAALTALSGIGIIAMPTGIMAAAFSEAMQKNRREKDD